LLPAITRRLGPAALGEDLPLAPDVVQATATVLGASLPLLAMAAAERPASPVAFVLAGDTIRLDLRYDGTSWQPDPGPGEETVRLSGDDTAVLLFALGRIVLDYPGLAVSGSQEDARSFKDYAPRPSAEGRVIAASSGAGEAPVLRAHSTARAAGTAAPAAVSWPSHGGRSSKSTAWGCPALTDRAGGLVRLPA
jgi:hypothetical protein